MDPVLRAILFLLRQHAKDPDPRVVSKAQELYADVADQYDEPQYRHKPRVSPRRLTLAETESTVATSSPRFSKGAEVTQPRPETEPWLVSQPVKRRETSPFPTAEQAAMERLHASQTGITERDGRREGDD